MDFIFKHNILLENYLQFITNLVFKNYIYLTIIFNLKTIYNI